MWPHERLYLTHLQERRALAYRVWQQSGYRNFAAHRDYLRHYLAAQKVLAAIRYRTGKE